MTKATLLAATTAFVLMIGPSFAQTVGVGTEVEFEPQHRTVIKEYVTTQRVRPVQLRERLTVGATLPADIEISTAPAEWGPVASRYRYVYSNDRVYFVEPSSRRVVHIID